MADRPQIVWTVVKTVTIGESMVEVSSSDGYQVRYSYRVTWTDGQKKGPWFPDRGISFVADLTEAVAEAEAWILDQRGKALQESEIKLAEKRSKEEQKRKRHGANLEQRRELNRMQSKGVRRG